MRNRTQSLRRIARLVPAPRDRPSSKRDFQPSSRPKYVARQLHKKWSYVEYRSQDG